MAPHGPEDSIGGEGRVESTNRYAYQRQGGPMPSRVVDRDDLRGDEDWEGNNVAFTCPRKDCGKEFLVSNSCACGSSVR
jgi:hypothetical protein